MSQRRDRRAASRVSSRSMPVPLRRAASFVRAFTSRETGARTPPRRRHRTRQAEGARPSPRPTRSARSRHECAPSRAPPLCRASTANAARPRAARSTARALADVPRHGPDHKPNRPKAARVLNPQPGPARHAFRGCLSPLREPVRSAEWGYTRGRRLPGDHASSHVKARLTMSARLCGPWSAAIKGLPTHSERSSSERTSISS
jgi:hypothetical protein